MAQLDPRRQALRLTPMILVSIAALSVGSLMWKVIAPLPSIRQVLDANALMALETRAMAAGAARPGYAEPVNIAVNLKNGETLNAALLRVGISPQEATAAINILAPVFDVTKAHDGLNLEAAIAHPTNATSEPAQLLGLTIRTGPAKQLTLTTSQDGAMRVRALEESVRDERRVAIGSIAGSFWTSVAQLGATQKVTDQLLKLFAHKLDFERDIQPGDKLKIVFDRKVTETGRTVEAGDLLYAEIATHSGVTRFYNFQRPGEKVSEYFDEFGKNIKGFLLTTPIYNARTTSGFGMRLHPIQGYMKKHTGIDFAAPTGTPILAAGDGVVADAKWWGGYGRWVRLVHSRDWDTGYGHMSAIAVHPGQHVKQGDVIGYVGTTGNSTGPHLHFEVWHDEIPINPKDAHVPQGTVLAGNELNEFRARKHELDLAIAERAKPMMTNRKPLRLAPHPIIMKTIRPPMRVRWRRTSSARSRMPAWP